MNVLRVITTVTCIMENVSTPLALTTAIVYMATLEMDFLITAVSMYSTLGSMLHCNIRSPYYFCPFFS